jgi:hypothetical protein
MRGAGPLASVNQSSGADPKRLSEPHVAHCDADSASGHMHMLDRAGSVGGGRTQNGCSCRTDAPHGVENLDPSAEALIYLIVERS